ncbi:hypothetical protein GOBAR_AA12876 [Gossypium barbadense]|uniref:Homogentisate phytyltransferase 1, chloroplastic n=1 Tax=Gossypium barbadense TaxID=3634 RepID=A0A2P5XWQ1_GOSBA|nr:hypothetical protein GOBAR_AA12876 [Gossypium barbadense]
MDALLLGSSTGGLSLFISVFQKSNTKFLVNATSGHPLESEPKAYPNTPWNSAKNALDAFYRFSRPHTVIGTALSIISVSLLAVEKLSDISPLFFTGAVVAALFMNIYIVGLNQLSDVEIDKVNKPYLPLASGEYSALTGIMIVTSFSIMSFWLGWIIGSWPLFWALFVSFVLGTAYSINIHNRDGEGIGEKFLLYIGHSSSYSLRLDCRTLKLSLFPRTHVFSRPAVISKPLIFATAFMSFFSVVIALFKDIPDIEGDKIFGIKSYTVRLGQEKVFWTCISLLEMAYGISILVGATSPYTWSKVITVLGHSVLASILWIHAKSVDLKSKAAITSCYMFIWKVSSVKHFIQMVTSESKDRQMPSEYKTQNCINNDIGL